MPAQDAYYYDYEDADREDARREARAARRRCSAPSCGCVSPCDGYYADEDEADEDCGGGRGGCPGCDGCEKAAQTYTVRRARRAYPGIKPGELYLHTGVRIYQRGGPTHQRRVMQTALSPAGRARAAAHLAAGGSRRITLALVVQLQVRS